MSTTTYIDSNDPIFDKIQNLPAVDDPFWRYRSNPTSLTFAKMGRMKWAERCEDCGLVWNYYCDVGGSKHGVQGHTRNSCNMKFCPDCAERMAHEACQRREVIFETLAMTRERLVYLESEIPVPHTLSEENIPLIRAWVEATYKRLLEQLEKKLHDLLMAKHIGHGPHWTYSPAIRNGKLVFRVLAVMDSQLKSSHDWRLIFPDASHTEVLFANAPMVKHFFERMMKPVIPAHPVHRAWQEILFERFRRLRSLAVFDATGRPPTDDHGIEDDAIITLEEEISVDNAPLKSRKAHIHCRVCGFLCSPRLESPHMQPAKTES